MSSGPTWKWRAALALLLLFYAAVSLPYLILVPPVYEDEPWQASAAWKLARDGVLGTDVFAGIGGAEKRLYGFLPAYPIILSGMFRVAGLGLFQMRLTAVLLGALALLLTYAVGRRLWGQAEGVLAVAFLLLVRLEPAMRFSPTGVLFLDASRISRYDMPVPVFGLAALLAYLATRDGPARRRVPLWIACGLLAGLATLSHIYGAFWMAAIGVLMLWDRAGWRTITAAAVGFAIPCAAWLLFVLQDLEGWRAQNWIFRPRFAITGPGWFLSNLVRETQRYAPGLGGPAGWLLRPGFWLGYALLAGSIVALAMRSRRDAAARAAMVCAVLMPVLFALLLVPKVRNYKVGFFPALALAAGWGAVALWRSGTGRRRLIVAALGAAVAVEGVARGAAVAASARGTTSYPAYIARIHAHVRPGERVLGLHTYWLGMQDTDYRSWYVPMALSHPNASEHPRPAPAILDGMDLDVVLVDSVMRKYLEQDREKDPVADQVATWMRGWTRVAEVPDATYGRMDVYRRRPPHP